MERRLNTYVTTVEGDDHSLEVWRYEIELDMEHPTGLAILPERHRESEGAFKSLDLRE